MKFRENSKKKEDDSVTGDFRKIENVDQENIKVETLKYLKLLHRDISCLLQLNDNRNRGAILTAQELQHSYD